jgi:hypothetical protein
MPAQPRRRAIAPGLALVLALSLAGCTAMDKNVVRMEEQVTPITVGDAAAVPAYVLASAMLRAGFTEDQVLNRGVALRDALATSGGAQVRDSDLVLALFSVHDNVLYVTSRTGGTFQVPLA